jgi:anti-sigma factor RsiW
MSERLSHLYRLATRRGAAPAIEADALQALVEGRLDGEARDALGARLAAHPDGPALLAFARASDREARLLAAELRRADAVTRSWSRPVRRRVAWLAAAAAAVLALSVPVAIMIGGERAGDLAGSAETIEIDHDLILAASFEPGAESASRTSVDRNGRIFSSRFDG